MGIYGNVAPGHSLAKRPRRHRTIIDELGMPPGYSMAFSGQVKILEETTTNMLLAFGLASIFMYMVLAAQFESLAHPFVILLTLPLVDSFRAAFADRHRAIVESVQRARHAAAAGNREEERHSADRLHEPSASAGHTPSTTPLSKPTASGFGRF